MPKSQKEHYGQVGLFLDLKAFPSMQRFLSLLPNIASDFRRDCVSVCVLVRERDPLTLFSCCFGFVLTAGKTVVADRSNYSLHISGSAVVGEMERKKTMRVTFSVTRSCSC